MSYGFAGALMGLGEGLNEIAEHKMQVAREALARKQKLEDRQTARDWQLEDEQRDQDRKDAHATATADAIKGLSDSNQGFVDAMTPVVTERLKARGINLDPRLVVAQAALETGYGKSAPGNNFFGIKSHGKPGGATHTTKEVVDGQEVTIKDSFRQYESLEASVDGYIDFLTSNPRYGALLSAEGLDAQIEALAASGYATDPKYGSKITSIARGINLTPLSERRNEAIRLASHADTTDAARGLLLNAAGGGEKKKRATAKDAKGVLRYIDDGSKVFPDDESEVDYSGMDDLRKEFSGLKPVKAFSDQAQAYGRIVASANNPSPAGDLALIFNYMKVLDPGSVVRESEFATAEQAAAWLQESEEAGFTVPLPVARAIRKAATGQRLSPEQRADFVDRGTVLYKNAETGFDALYEQYGAIADTRGFNREQALIDFRYKGESFGFDQPETKAELSVDSISQMTKEQLDKISPADAKSSKLSGAIMDRYKELGVF